MAGLTWQDVAGHVRAPDYSDSSGMITQGIEGLGKAVQDVIGAPEQRRQVDLANQMRILGARQGFTQQNAKQMDALGDDIKLDKKEKDAMEFSAAQSVLEAGAREAALSGKSYDDFLKSDAYLGLSAGARAYGASHLSDSYLRGDETRMMRQERAADNARQQQQWAAGFALQRQSAARQDREMDLRIGQLKKAEKDALAAQGILSEDPETNLAYGQRRAQVAQQLAPLARGMELYGNLTPKEAAKKSGMDENWFFDASTEAQQVAANIEKNTGKKVQNWMINQLLMEGGGADNWDLNPGGGLDNKQAEEYLMSLVGLQDAAIYNQQFLNRMDENIRGGKKYSADALPSIMTGIAAPATPKRGSAPPKPKPWAPAVTAMPTRGRNTL